MDKHNKAAYLLILILAVSIIIQELWIHNTKEDIYWMQKHVKTLECINAYGDDSSCGTEWGETITFARAPFYTLLQNAEWECESWRNLTVFTFQKDGKIAVVTAGSNAYESILIEGHDSVTNTTYLECEREVLVKDVTP